MSGKGKMTRKKQQLDQIRGAIYRMQVRRARSFAYRMVRTANWDDPTVQLAVLLHTGVDLGVKTDAPIEGQTEIPL